MKTGDNKTNVKPIEFPQKPTIEQFKDGWEDTKSYITMELTDAQIQDYIDRAPNLTIAIDWAADYLLANGLADVQE